MLRVEYLDNELEDRLGDGQPAFCPPEKSSPEEKRVLAL
jgi:hypothetical protein